jgi:hypothetical protein
MFVDCAPRCTYLDPPWPVGSDVYPPQFSPPDVVFAAVKRGGVVFCEFGRGLAQTPFCGVCDLPKGPTFPSQFNSGKSVLSRSMPFYRRIYSPGEPQFIATRS